MKEESWVLGCVMGVLFRDEIGWMENFGEKMGMKTFLECIWLGGEEEK